MSRSRKKTLRKNKSRKRMSYKKNMNNKIIQLKIPNNRNIKWAWLIEINKKDRYKVRYPKKNILINDLYKKNNKDFGPVKLAPKGSSIFTSKKQKGGAEGNHPDANRIVDTSYSDSRMTIKL
jgi:hypothetical protein